MARELLAVTGAFGFSGKYIAKRLLDSGHPAPWHPPAPAGEGTT